jgi:hypothetical protein
MYLFRSPFPDSAPEALRSQRAHLNSYTSYQKTRKLLQHWEVLTVEAQGDMMRNFGATKLLKCMSVEDEQE